jgi:general secretion pathway protein K
MAGVSGRRARRGSILVAVLWLLLLLGVLAVSLRATMGSVAVSVRAAEEQAASRMLAGAALEASAVELRAARLRPAGAEARAAFTHRLAGGVATVEALTESAFVDFNVAGPLALEAALRAAGADARSAQTLALRVLDWRDTDDSRSGTGGAEREDYLAARAASLPRNGAFQSLDEVGLVLGMPAALMPGLRRTATVASGTARLRLDAIDPDLLPFLKELPKDLPKVLADFGKGRIKRRDLDAYLARIPAHAARPGPVWRLRLTIVLDGGHVARYQATVLAAGADTQAYRILDWREGDGFAG